LFGNGLQNGLYDVKLFDATGRLVQQKSLANYLGNNQWNCSIDNSNSGISSWTAQRAEEVNHYNHHLLMKILKMIFFGCLKTK
jgi:hypothetical protein